MAAARASNVYFFVNAEVAETASRCLAELMGGVMDVSKFSKDGLATAALRRVQEQCCSLATLAHKKSKMQALRNPVADASACTTGSEKVLKKSKMEDKTSSPDDDVSVIVDGMGSTQEDSVQSKESCRISVGDASTPDKMSESNDETAAASSASAVPSSFADQSNQQVEVEKESMST